MKKHPITIVLTEDTHKALKKRAEEESRPVAQMARVIIEKALRKEDEHEIGEGTANQRELLSIKFREDGGIISTLEACEARSEMVKARGTNGVGDN